MKTRTLLIGLAGAAACAALAIVMLDRDDNASTRAPRAARVESTARAAVAAPSLAPAVAVAAPGAAAPVVKDTEPLDGSEYPVDPAPPTREEPLTDDQRDPRMKRSIEMLDQAVARSEARLAAAEAAGDKEAATTARVRIERLREVRKQRASELESMQ